MSKTYIINNENGVAVSKLTDTVPFNDAGQKGWTLQSSTFAGIDCNILCAGKDADVFPLHTDMNEWMGYVLEGNGELHIGDEKNITEKIEYNTGDVIIFKPGTYHGWKSYSDSTKLMFVKVH